MSAVTETKTGNCKGSSTDADEVKRVSCEEKNGAEVKHFDSDVYKPWGTRSRSNSDCDTRSDTEDGGANCKGGPGKMTCGELVQHGELGVRCDVCKLWFHSECQAILKESYTALKKFKILSWICAECKLSLLKPKDSVHPNHVRIVNLESKIDHIESMVKENLQKIQESMTEHVRTTNAQLRQIELAVQAVELQKGSYAQAVKGTCNDMVKQVTANIDAIPKPVQQKPSVNTAEEISGVFDNFLDKEKRKANLVVHNLEESSGVYDSEIIKQDVKKFIDVVKQGMKV